MTYQAFYRVYRPQSFREMSGQVHVKRTLQNALRTDHTTHAYLFSGPRGTGKTSTAKIFAKALNCEHAPAEEPCNECATCKSITEGSHPDVIEFDAASNSRVEEIREVIEKVRFAPASARYKVYMVDEVHMLSTSAFNALLKTLEEPPAHVVFILATTEPHKVPATIISRCQRFDFKRLSSIDIVERMKVVLEDIEFDYDDKALKIIAQSASGGMRDALSMLDQVVSFSADKVEVTDALFVTGSINEDTFYDLTEAIVAKDVANVLALLEQLMADGKDAVRLTEDLITFFRDLLLIQTAPELGDLLELASSEEKFQQLAEKLPGDTLYNYIDVLSKTQQDMRFSLHAKVYLETALLKMVQSSVLTMNSNHVVDAPALQEMQSQIAALQNMVMQLQQTAVGGVVQAMPQQVQPQQRKAKPQGKEFKIPVGRIKEIMAQATKKDIQQIKGAWAEAIGQLPKSQAALLADAEPAAAADFAFVLKFKHEILCQMASDNRALINQFAQLLAGMTGTMYDIAFVPEEAWHKIRAEFVAQHKKQKDEETPENALSSGKVEQENVQSLIVEEQQQSEDPIVSEAEKLFGKDFIEVVEE